MYGKDVQISNYINQTENQDTFVPIKTVNYIIWTNLV
jgi:hypothetical protein